MIQNDFYKQLSVKFVCNSKERLFDTLEID